MGYFAYNRVSGNSSSNAGAGSYVGKVKRYQDMRGGSGVGIISGTKYQKVGKAVTENSAQFLPRGLNVKACSHFRKTGSTKTQIAIKDTYSGIGTKQTYYSKGTYNICTNYFSTGSKGRNAAIQVSKLSGENFYVDTMYYAK